MKTLLPLAALLALGACAAIPPAGPSLVALPQSGKSLQAFQADEASCRTYAQGRIGLAPDAPPGAAQNTLNSTTSYALQRGYDVAYAQCMTSHGDVVQNPPAQVVVTEPYPYPYYGGGVYGPVIGFGFGGYYGGYNRGYRRW